MASRLLANNNWTTSSGRPLFSYRLLIRSMRPIEGTLELKAVGWCPSRPTTGLCSVPECEPDDTTTQNCWPPRLGRPQWGHHQHLHSVPLDLYQASVDQIEWGKAYPLRSFKFCINASNATDSSWGFQLMKRGTWRSQRNPNKSTSGAHQFARWGRLMPWVSSRWTSVSISIEDLQENSIFRGDELRGRKFFYSRTKT